MTTSTTLTDDAYPGWSVIVPADFSEDDPTMHIVNPHGQRRSTWLLIDAGGTLVVPGSDVPLPAEWAVPCMAIYLAQF